ncbi:helix-turn-helix transcriptional regulator [Streptomyces sp. AK02-04a]|uniref:helix-turn-helix domain-containing protein n=1 Tax=Streptomyces sp. AK02-04a TaxID=3028649 RepID=UPI0029B5C07B|nr:helix-turn-helix transcriptional regulator [Streptomyces sp. AK02-04a]MDX3759280.1 helix-turn-helix transcriptional regulator [Streptomyces sp. AK02-04a]
MTPEPAQPEPRYVLLDPDLLRRLMERTGTGHSISGRELARRVSVPHGTIDNLLNGNIKSQPSEIAHSICRTIGVDILILWAPAGRAVPAGPEDVGALTRSVVAA